MMEKKTGLTNYCTKDTCEFLTKLGVEFNEGNVLVPIEHVAWWLFEEKRIVVGVEINGNVYRGYYTTLDEQGYPTIFTYTRNMYLLPFGAIAGAVELVVERLCI